MVYATYVETATTDPAQPNESNDAACITCERLTDVDEPETGKGDNTCEVPAAATVDAKASTVDGNRSKTKPARYQILTADVYYNTEEVRQKVRSVLASVWYSN